MKQSYWQLLVEGVVLNCLGFILSTLWFPAEKGYVIQSIAVFVWLNALLVLGAIYERRWCVYVLAGVTLVGGWARCLVTPRSSAISASLIEVRVLGIVGAFIARLKLL
jgi:hypothetical protein